MSTIDTIDTTKPLELPGVRTDVTFISETSDGHVLVDLSDYGWAIFSKQGALIRAASGVPSLTGLRNAAVEKTLYVGLSYTLGRDALRINDEPHNGTGVASIALTFKNGILVDASVERANTHPIRQVDTQMPLEPSRRIDLA